MNERHIAFFLTPHPSACHWGVRHKLRILKTNASGLVSLRLQEVLCRSQVPTENARNVLTNPAREGDDQGKSGLCPQTRPTKDSGMNRVFTKYLFSILPCASHPHSCPIRFPQHLEREPPSCSWPMITASLSLTNGPTGLLLARLHCEGSGEAKLHLLPQLEGWCFFPLLSET